MRASPIHVAVLFGLAPLLCAGGAVAQTSKTIRVDCANHDSIQQALGHPAHELVIEIRGMCREKVVVERKNVTLRGADSSADGITGPVLTPNDPNERALVTVHGGAKGVRFENLAITASELRGLEVTAESMVDVANCRVTGNGTRGLQVNSSAWVTVTDTEISNNGELQILAFGEGALTCTRCTMTGSAGDGVAASAGGRVVLTDSTVDVAGWGLIADENGYITSLRGMSIASPSVAVYSSRKSQVVFNDGQLSGSVRVYSKSLVQLGTVTQTANPRSNFVFEDSTLTLENGTLIGLTYLTRFSNGTADAGSALGQLVCDKGADFFCDPGVVRASSSCAQCPVR